MTAFIKEDFHWDGMYLMYQGDCGIHGIYYFSNMSGGCHPTRHATMRDQFIARFKHGSKPWKTWVNFIVKNFTVEEWIEMERHQGMSPVDIMESKGFMDAQQKKMCREAGVPVTLENAKRLWEEKMERHLEQVRARQVA